MRDRRHHYGSGPRFTNGFSIAIQIRWKFRFALTSILIKWSLPNFLHGTTAVLSWHVQKFAAIWWPITELQQGKLSVEFEFRAKNVSETGPWTVNVYPRHFASLRVYTLSFMADIWHHYGLIFLSVYQISGIIAWLVLWSISRIFGIVMGLARWVICQIFAPCILAPCSICIPDHNDSLLCINVRVCEHISTFDLTSLYPIKWYCILQYMYSKSYCCHFCTYIICVSVGV